MVEVNNMLNYFLEYSHKTNVYGGSAFIYDIVFFIIILVIYQNKGIDHKKNKNIIYLVLVIIYMTTSAILLRYEKFNFIYNHVFYIDVVKIFLLPLLIYQIARQHVITYGMVVGISLIWLIVSLGLNLNLNILIAPFFLFGFF